jgi:hypothetical protein
MKEFSPTKRSSRSVPVVTPASREKRNRLHHASRPTGNVTTWPSSQKQPSTHQGGGPTLKDDATGTCDGVGGASGGSGNLSIFTIELVYFIFDLP